MITTTFIIIMIVINEKKLERKENADTFPLPFAIRNIINYVAFIIIIYYFKYRRARCHAGGTVKS